MNPSEGLLNIFKQLSKEVYFTKRIDSNFYLFALESDYWCKLFHFNLTDSRLASFLLTHIAYLISFFKVVTRVHLIIISQVSDYPLLVLLVGRVVNKKVIDFVGGSRTFLSRVVLHSRTTILRKIASLYGIASLKIVLRIVNKSILISGSLTHDYPFNKFKHKIQIAWNFPPSNFFYNEFTIKKRYDERDAIIGYIGKFTRAKGIYNLALAVKNIIKSMPEIKVIFVGNYQNSEPPYLGSEIKNMFKAYNNVIFTDEVPHKKVADYLNELRLLVLPSYSEGLPHVILEAMACGTPILATSVGAIPDIIRDGETGFLLKSNDPKYIAEKIMELLKKPNLLRKVSINAYNYVRENFSYEKTLEIWRKILSEL